MTNRTTTIKLGAVAIGFLAGLNGSTALADQVILDDLIVDGSACIGQDCVNGESFGFDTLRLKENNLRIKAQDTSASASFPTNDWQITFNDSSNGGQNKFSIDDIDGGRTPFTIEAASPSNSLYVDSSGNVGFGKANPVVQLHVVDGNSPTLRLEQDGSSGFTPQTFDVAANEANFFVRDVTNGSALPFRIQPGADTNALYIENTNDIGIGTNAPSSQLHIRQTDKSAVMHIEDASSTIGNLTMLQMTNVGRPRIQMTNTNPTVGQAGDWSISAGNSFVLQDRTDSQNVMIIDQDGNMTITGSLNTTNPGGACDAGCDRVFDADYDLPSITDHAAMMWEKRYLPAVGPTPENGPMNVTHKVGRMLNELEKAHIYIEQLNNEFTEMREHVASLEAKLQSQN